MYVVIGATGHTGKVVAERLLAAGKKVKAVGRSHERLADLVEKGAIAAVGNLMDADFLKETLAEAEGMYAMIPPKFDATDFRAYQREVAENLANAVKVNKVPYVVTLSSFGAHEKKGLGVVSGLYPMEQLFNAIAETHVAHLRAGYFFENFLVSIPVIKSQGVLGGFPIAGDVPIDMVLTTDIGNKAADLLLAKDFSGNHVIFLSHGQYTLNKATALLGKAIGKADLQYVAFPAEGARQAMIDMGMSESLADNYVEFSQGSTSGKLTGDNNNHEKHKTPGSLEDFASSFAAMYKK